MADVVLSSCCYTQLVFSATSWGLSTTPGDVFTISGDTVIPQGCYTVISLPTGTTTTFNGTATVTTGCTDPLCYDCCDLNICVDIPLSTYSGYNGTYEVVGAHNGYIYYTGATQPGYLYFDTTKWCLASGLSQTCLFYGSNPTGDLCPDLDTSIATSGTCTPTPTPYDPCSILDFDVLLDCILPTPTPTPTATPGPTPTPTPTPTINPCDLFVVDFTYSAITPTPTPSPTPSPTPTPTVYPYNITSGVTFVVDSGYFDCPEVKVLEDCSSSNIYYVSNPLVVSGNPVSTGTTLLVVVNSEYKCVTYTDSIFGSPSDYLNLVITSYTSGCTSCIAPTPTPTPTPTATPTPTPTATPTPTPTYAPNTQFVFTSCTNNSMIIQYSYPPANITQGNVIKDISGNCFTYVDYYLNYTPPVGFVWSFIEMFTASTTTNYGNCIGCLTPAPTPTEAFRTWRGYGSFSLSCPICELTNGGTSYTFYTSPTVSSLATGVYIYQDSLLQTPLLVSYLRYLGIIYSVDSEGRLTQLCNQNSNC
jgi:hypothetical protein